VLSEAERDFYSSIYKQTRTKFDAFVEQGTLLHNYAHIFDLLSRLRQAADHPYLVVHGRHGGAQYKGTQPPPLPSKSHGGADICGICQDEVLADELALSGCKHAFHRRCIRHYAETAPAPPALAKKKGKAAAAPALGCPVCYLPLSVGLDFDSDGDEEAAEDEDGAGDRKKRKASPKAGRASPPLPAAVPAVPEGEELEGEEDSDEEELRLALQMSVEVAADQLKPQRAAVPPQPVFGRRSLLHKVKLDNFASSSKLEALATQVGEALSADPANKCIVFSQFSNFLDIVEWRLSRDRHKTVKLLGSMPVSMRESVLSAFKTDPKVRVILLSLKAGGEGLNLQAASHVFMCDPWWNPAVEMQAIQRAHRIGQTRAVKAVRFITTDTIEARMLELQEKKQLVFDGTMDGSAVALSRLTPEDLRFLFQN
jgi:DNA repair protein RAD16